MDGDGDPDVLVGTTDSPNRLYHNLAGNPPIWTRSDVTADVHATWSVLLQDVEGDGDLDVLAGNAYPVLHFMDPNQPDAITGYHVYRSSDPVPPPDTWPLLATDIIDMDEATPNKQWVDTSGDVSPTGSWYYQVTGYNHRCPTQDAEGPF